MECLKIKSKPLNKKKKNFLGFRLYYECILINLTFLFLKSLKIKFEYKGFPRIAELNVRNCKLSIAKFFAS